MEGEIPSQGIKDLYKANLEAGRTKVTDNLLIRFPSLKGTEPEKVAERAPIEPAEPVVEPPKRSNSHGKVRKR